MKKHAAALFYGTIGNGFDPFGGTKQLPLASEAVFHQATAVASKALPYWRTMITGTSLAEAEQIVDQGYSADGTFPKQPVVLAKSSVTLATYVSVFDKPLSVSRSSEFPKY